MERTPASGGKKPEQPSKAPKAPVARGRAATASMQDLLGNRALLQVLHASGPVSTGATAPPPTPPSPESVASRLGAGVPLETALSAHLSLAPPASPDGVQVHLDSPVPESLGARALTVGSHVAFAPGRFQPRTTEGRGLLVHELTHVLQQRRGQVQAGGHGRTGDAGEREARLAAEQGTRDEASAIPFAAARGIDHGRSAMRLAIQKQEDPAKDVVPEPLSVTWGGDKFVLAFEAEKKETEGEVLHLLHVGIAYVGGFPVEFEFAARRLTKRLGPAAFKASATVLPSGGVAVDPFGDGANAFNILDAYEFDAFKKARRHAVTRIDAFGSDTVHVLVADPAANASDRSQAPKPFSAAEAPVFIGGIAAIDLSLGPYGDRFRVTLQTTNLLADDKPATINFGISALWQGKPVQGFGRQFSFQRTPVIQMLSASAGQVSLDLDGDGQSDLALADSIRLPQEIDTVQALEVNRNHDVTVTGPQFGSVTFPFNVRWNNYGKGSWANASDVDKNAVSNARAVSGLAERRQEGETFSALIDAIEGAMLPIRADAVKAKLIPQALYDAWLECSKTMLTLRPRALADEVDSSLQADAIAKSGKLYGELAAATADKEEIQPSYGDAVTSLNKYTGKSTVTTTFLVWSRKNEFAGAAAQVPGRLVIRDWQGAFRAYRKLVGGLDSFIADKLVETKGKDDPAARRASPLVARLNALSELEQYDPIVIPAVFHPDAKFTTEEGFIPELPLALFAWKEGNAWTLRDLTIPDKPYDFHADAQEGSADPPVALFGQMNDPDHFPVGRIHFQVPGSYGGQVATQDYLTWKQFLSYLGMGLALVGLTLATFGEGTVAVVGAWALAGSAVAGGASAAIDMIDKAQHGALDALTVVIDVAQIVASIAQVGALKAGIAVKMATEAAEAGTPLAGNAALSALRSQTMYAIWTSTRIGADAVTLVAIGAKSIDEINAIEKGSGSPEEKARAERMMLTMLAINGGMFALSVKGELPKLAGDRTLVLHHPVRGGPAVASIGGEELPSALKFSQKNVAGMTGDQTLTLDDLAKSMKTEGWKGDPIDVVELADGSKVTLDNRRLLAAQMAGLEKIPVAYHAPSDPLPPGRNPVDPETGKQAFQLEKPIYEKPDGTWVVGGKKSPDWTERYPKGFVATTYGEAALVRNANQGAKFGLGGSFDPPKVRSAPSAAPPIGGHADQATQAASVDEVLSKLTSKQLEALRGTGLSDVEIATHLRTLGDVQLFRGTTPGFPGNAALQKFGITPASTDPLVATVFALEGKAIAGEAVVLTGGMRTLAGGDIDLGNVRRILEREVQVNMLPAQFEARAPIAIPVDTARRVLSEMGIADLPPTIRDTQQGTQILNSTSRLTPEQIQEFLKRCGIGH